ncbi:MAG: GNAT family N-acetyltransferase [Eubacterium sp.]|nr:GNAT family N-acetyltransferase [Eubacterium sp.]
MRLVHLSKTEITQLYNDRMVEDFPPDELKPLDRILDALDKGFYECLGMIEEKSILGYAFMVKHEKDYLVDYIAICSERRNEGLGGQLLRLFNEYLSEAASIIGEVENPEYTEDEELRSLQSRRIDFYLRNGLRNTGVTVTCFDVPYIILEMDRKNNHSEDEIKELYRMHYKKMLPDKMYRENVFV